jgi:signal transduction histidine kinase
MSVGRATRLALCLLGIAVGVVSVVVDPADPFSATVDLVAGWAVIAAGLVFWARRPASRAGPLLTAAGFAWLLAVWNAPGIGSSAGFAVGLVGYALAPPLLAHAAFAFPTWRPTRIDSFALALAYAATVGVLGLLPALTFDPRAAGCGQCPANPLQLIDSPGLYADLNRVGLWLGLVWAPLLIGLLGFQLVRCSPALRKVKAPLTVAAVACLALVVWDYVVSLDSGFLTAGGRTGEAFAFIGAAAGVGWTWVLARRTRRDMARLVVELAGSPQPGKLRDMLAAKLGDPSLRLAYPMPGGGFVDADGRPVTVADRRNANTATSLSHEDREIAVLTHRPGLFDDPALAEEVTAASLLALENERLQAELNAQLTELRASRTRIVAAGDAERRRLERDLHDGAQQHLAALLLSSGVARMRSDDATLAAVEHELRGAADELQTLARGVFPAILADEGLAAAVESLAEEASVRIVALPTVRLGPAVETAAYFAIARAVPDEGTLTVTAVLEGGRLVITLDGAGTVTGIGDRIAAIDGLLATDPNGLIRVELPCGS